MDVPAPNWKPGNPSVQEAPSAPSSETECSDDAEGTEPHAGDDDSDCDDEQGEQLYTPSTVAAALADRAELPGRLPKRNGRAPSKGAIRPAMIAALIAEGLGHAPIVLWIYMRQRAGFHSHMGGTPGLLYFESCDATADALGIKERMLRKLKEALVDANLISENRPVTAYSPKKERLVTHKNARVVYDPPGYKHEWSVYEDGPGG